MVVQQPHNGKKINILFIYIHPWPIWLNQFFFVTYLDWNLSPWLPYKLLQKKIYTYETFNPNAKQTRYLVRTQCIGLYLLMVDLSNWSVTMTIKCFSITLHAYIGPSSTFKSTFIAYVAWVGLVYFILWITIIRLTYLHNYLVL